MNLSLQELRASGAFQDFKLIKRGIEKESLRINLESGISKKAHPSVLGSALTNPYITTDFSEALLELVTPTFTDVQDCLDFLTEIHAFVHKRIDSELLWPFSMPCPISSDDDIPIGRYGVSNSGTMKTAYRKGLSYRYGHKMQAIAGIHYNFSFPNEFFSKIAAIKNKDQSNLQELKNESYLSVARNFKRVEWLYFLLFGASPVICDTFTNKKMEGFEECLGGSLLKSNATSLRMGDLGYISAIQDDLNISINTLEEYCQDLKSALTKPHTPYEAIGEFSGKERIQLNTAIIQIENEYYSTIRPKRICPYGERPINVLKDQGIDYLELRCVDLDPFSPIGIERDQADFLDMLLIYCFIEDSPILERKESERLKINHKKIINFGRQDGLMVYKGETEVSIKEFAKEIFDRMEEISNFASDELFFGKENYWKISLDIQKEKLNNIEKTPSARLEKELTVNQKSYRDLGMELAKLHSKHFNDYSAKRDREFSDVASASIKKQQRIESEDKLSFEDYLKEFLNKIS